MATARRARRDLHVHVHVHEAPEDVLLAIAARVNEFDMKFAAIEQRLSVLSDISQGLRRLEQKVEALQTSAAQSAVREEAMAGQGDQIKAILQRVDAATNEAAKDVAELIAKVKAGAPDLLTPAEMAAAEATVARLEKLGTDTDASTVNAGGATANPPQDATGQV